MKKICSTCKKEKNTGLFGVSKLSQDGYRGVCKECYNLYMRNYNLKNKGKKALSDKEYYEKNREVILEKQRIAKKWLEYEKQPQRKAYKKEYQKTPQRKAYCRKYNRDYDKRPIKKIYNKKYRDARKDRPDIKAKNAIRLSILQALRVRGISKSAQTIEYLGCDVAFFKMYIESLWEKNMTWENHSKKGWHLDHIRPCASFDLSDIEEQKKCFNFSNYQPLWAKDNLKKGAKLIA